MYIVNTVESIISRFARELGQMRFAMDSEEVWQSGDNAFSNRFDALKHGIKHHVADRKSGGSFAIVHVLPPTQAKQLLVLDTKVTCATHCIVGPRIWPAIIGLEKSRCVVEIVQRTVPNFRPILLLRPIGLNLTVADKDDDTLLTILHPIFSSQSQSTVRDRKIGDAGA